MTEAELAACYDEINDAFAAYEGDPSIVNATRLVKAQRAYSGNWPGNDWYTPIMDRVITHYESEIARLTAELASCAAGPWRPIDMIDGEHNEWLRRPLHERIAGEMSELRKAALNHRGEP